MSKPGHDVVRNSPCVSSFLIRAPAMTHRSVNSWHDQLLPVHRGWVILPGQVWGEQTCDDFIQIPEMLRCLKGLCFLYRALHLCFSPCVSQTRESEQTGPTRSMSLRSVGCYYTLMTTCRVWDSGRNKRHDPVYMTFMTCRDNVWGLSHAFQCSLGGVPRSPQDTTAHRWDGNFPFLVLPKLVQVFGKLWDSSQMRLLQPQQSYGSPGALWEMTNVPF